MNQHIEYSLLQDYWEGLLDPEAETAVQAHLESCPRCHQEFEDFSEFMTDLRALPTEAYPARDLWPQVAWRTREQSKSEDRAPTESAESRDRFGGSEALGRGVGHGKRSQVSRRVSLPAWQLLAASIALIVISGGSVWAILSGSPGALELATPKGGAMAQMVGWEEAYGEYDQAVADLEAVLEKGREVLDPETIRVLEENLQSIDRAIQEAGDALMNDPASTLLQRFLADNLRKKVDLLRRAAGAVYAST